MRRFQGKSVLVVVTALLLLGDIFGMRSSVPKLGKDVPPAEYAALVAQAVVLPTVEFQPEVSAPVRRSLPILPVRTSDTVVVSFIQSAVAYHKPLPTPLPDIVGPMTAHEREDAPLPELWLASVPRQVLKLPVVRLDDALPPRKWVPPEGIAYIRWWTV